ncbi:MAG: hypothetical protein A2Y94_11540 [Caldithrix sp. RBG_13_44_9]|nr:MAG: hypothetical protein A2Y94_11540 [Caldithrix sp. RBG_13_44_9]
MIRQNISSGTKWEPLVGYSRAVRIGSQIFIAGTTAVGEDGKIVGQNDPAKQTAFIIQKIEKALQLAEASLKDVVVTRIFVKNINDWELIGRTHGKFFAEIRPATTMVEVSNLIEPEMLLEIEALAVVSD